MKTLFTLHTAELKLSHHPMFVGIKSRKARRLLRNLSRLGVHTFYKTTLIRKDYE